MLSKDFRGYLDYLEKTGKLLRVKKKVDVKHEIAAGIRKTSDNDGPALVFENIKGYPGWRVAGGLYATKKLMALALETKPDEHKLLQRYLECDEKRVKPKLVSTGPVKEIIIKGDDVDLTKMPILTYCEKDSGPFLIPAADIAKHPETGIQNVTIGRRKVLDQNRTALRAAPQSHMEQIITAGEDKGQGVGVATVLGAPPELTIASQVKAPMGVDETEIAGAFRGEPLEVVKCETIDVEVPANAEVIIEGIVMPGQRETDGPFGEFHGDYILTIGAGLNCYVVKITAITMRKNPIFQAMATGMPMTEDHWLRKWAAAAHRIVSRTVTYPEDVKGVNLTEGSALCNLIISIHKRFERTPQDIICALLASDLLFTSVIVVDEDVNIYDPYEVERVWATRVVPGRIIIPPAPPTASTYSGPGQRMGMDATVPIKDKQWYTKAVPARADKVDYI